MASDNIPLVFKDCEFILGAAREEQFPDDDLVEIAFAGRSNVGKSSALNAITGRRKLARTSKVPGRTQQINFFTLGDSARLVDLPGYGYAQVPLNVKKEWQKTIHRYLASRQNLIVLVLLMDIRHPMTELDQQMLDWAYESDLPTQILLTKADKLSRGKVKSTQLDIERQLTSRYNEKDSSMAVEPFSSLKGLGVQELRLQMVEWLST